MFIRKIALPLLALVSLITVTSLSCSVAGTLPNPFASATPTATATLTPTLTPTTMPTPTVTPTFTPTPTSVDVKRQGDGTTYVHDWDNRYELTLPAKWLVVPLTKEDLDQMVQTAAAEDPAFAKVADAYKDMDPNIFRVFGLNTDVKYAKGSYPTLVVVSAVKDPLASSMPMEFVTAMIEDKVLTGSTDTTWSVKRNAHGVEIGIVEGSMKVIVPNKGTQSAKAKVIAFQANKKLIVVEFATPTQFAAEVLPGVDAMIDTIQITEP